MPKAKRTKKLPSVEYLRECLDYYPDSGELYWKHRPRKHFISDKGFAVWNGKNAGTLAGYVNLHGYCVIKLNKLYLAHRLAWKLKTNKEPPKTIDHRDGNSTNNTWSNLRAATMSEQMWNSRFRRNNTTGYRGVVLLYDGRYRAAIWINGRAQHLGRFATAEEAAKVYEAAARRFHGKFYREVKQ